MESVLIFSRIGEEDKCGRRNAGLRNVEHSHGMPRRGGRARLSKSALEESVQLRRRDSHAASLCGAIGMFKQLHHTLTGQSRNKDYRSVIEKLHLIAHDSFELRRSPGSLLDQIPFVHRDY